MPYDSESSVTTKRGGTGGREVQEGGDIYIYMYLWSIHVDVWQKTNTIL